MAFLGPLMAGVFGVLTGKTSTITPYVHSLTTQPSVHHPPTGTHKGEGPPRTSRSRICTPTSQTARGGRAAGRRSATKHRNQQGDCGRFQRSRTANHRRGRLCLGYPESHFWKQEQRREEMRDFVVAASIATSLCGR